MIRSTENNIFLSYTNNIPTIGPFHFFYSQHYVGTYIWFKGTTACTPLQRVFETRNNVFDGMRLHSPGSSVVHLIVHYVQGHVSGILGNRKKIINREEGT